MFIRILEISMTGYNENLPCHTALNFGHGGYMIFMDNWFLSTTAKYKCPDFI